MPSSCDRTKIREILLNIISNSIKYTPEGGKISVKIEETPAPRKGFASYRITVKDNGIGMSKEYLPHILKNLQENIPPPKATSPEPASAFRS